MKEKMSPLRWVMIQMKGRFMSVFGLFILSLLFALVQWLEPRMLERIVNAATAREFDFAGMVLYLVLLLFSTLPVMFWYTRRLITSVVFDLEQRVMKHLVIQDAAFFDRNQPVELREKLQKGLGGTNRLLYVFTSGQLLVRIPSAFFAAWFIGQYNLWAVVTLGLFMIVFLFGGAKLGKSISEKETIENETDTVITRKKQEVIDNVLFLKQQLATISALLSIRQDDDLQLGRSHYLTKLYAIFDWLSGQASVVSGFVMVVFFLPEVVNGNMSAGTLLAIYMYCDMVTSPALSWGDIYSQMKSAWSEAEPLSSFFTERPTLVDHPQAIKLEKLKQAIRFEGVTFAYAPRSKPVLRDVSFMIPKGKMTAIVGGSGGGKSTIAKLLLRQYDTLAGDIFFDDISLTMVQQNSLFAQVAYLQQETPLFTGTVRENVDLKDQLSDEVILRVLHSAMAHFALGMGGLDLKVTELSGGEKQRLALARMLLQGCSVVVLDEATAALDQATEREVVSVLDDLRRRSNLTQVVIAHRLSTVEHADQIIVMHEGRVSAIGTHNELLSSSAVYQDLCKTFVREEE